MPPLPNLQTGSMVFLPWSTLMLLLNVVMCDMVGPASLFVLPHRVLVGKDWRCVSMPAHLVSDWIPIREVGPGWLLRRSGLRSTEVRAGLQGPETDSFVCVLISLPFLSFSRLFFFLLHHVCFLSRYVTNLLALLGAYKLVRYKPGRSGLPSFGMGFISSCRS